MDDNILRCRCDVDLGRTVVFRVRVEVDGDGGPDGDPVANDEDDHDIAGIPIYDLALIKELSAGQGPNIDLTGTPPTASFDITVKNQGPTVAYLIDVVEYNPLGMAITGFTADGGGLVSEPVANSGSYQITQLDPDQEVTFTVELTVTDATLGEYLNGAEISAFDDNTDPGDALSPFAVDVDSTPDGTDDDDILPDPFNADDPRNSHNDIDYDIDPDFPPRSIGRCSRYL